jgi:hypothetical protein
VDFDDALSGYRDRQVWEERCGVLSDNYFSPARLLTRAPTRFFSAKLE